MYMAAVTLKIISLSWTSVEKSDQGNHLFGNLENPGKIREFKM